MCDDNLWLDKLLKEIGHGQDRNLSSAFTSTGKETN